MDTYTVTGYRGTRSGWDATNPLIEPTTLEASDSFDAAIKALKGYLDIPYQAAKAKLTGIQRPMDSTDMFFKTKRPTIVLQVETVRAEGQTPAQRYRKMEFGLTETKEPNIEFLPPGYPGIHD